MRIELLGNIDKESRMKIISSAGSLSRTKGTVFEVYDSKNFYEKNVKLIKNIIKMGHKSIIEHDYYVFGLEDVTPIIEQILIGSRLASFTVKSRREVDFSNVGYYVPTFHDQTGNVHPENEQLTDIYKEYMDFLFKQYQEYRKQNIKEEDARYILPYSYHSNLIMGMDARELEKVTTDLLYGNHSHIDEVKELGEQLEKIMKEKIPYFSEGAKKKEDIESELAKELYQKFGKPDVSIIEKPEMISYTPNADEKVLEAMIISKYQCTSSVAKKMVEQLSEEERKKYMHYLVENSSNRELEQINFQYQIPIPLAILTHLTRHRMQSLIIPNFVPLWDFDNYIIPDSIKQLDENHYHEIYRKNKEMKEFFQSKNVREEDLVYFYLSGHKCNVLTTINGNSLRWISSMRCCNKAQKEIRDIVNELAKQAREVAPIYGANLGPSCEVFHMCPEGKECCGKIKKKVSV